MEGAMQDQSRVIGLSPGTMEALFNRSFARKQLGDHVGALYDAEQAIALRPDDPDAWDLKGSIHLLLGEHSEAIAHYDRAIQLDPNAAQPHYNKGIALVMAYQLYEGCRELHRSQELGAAKAAEAIRYFCAF